MSEEKIYELRQDIWTPAFYIKAGKRGTEAQWKERLGDFNMSWSSEWFFDVSEQKNEPRIDELNELINTVFKSMGLNSLSYKSAAREVAEEWLKQNKLK